MGARPGRRLGAPKALSSSRASRWELVREGRVSLSSCAVGAGLDLVPPRLATIPTVIRGLWCQQKGEGLGLGGILPGNLRIFFRCTLGSPSPRAFLPGRRCRPSQRTRRFFLMQGAHCYYFPVSKSHPPAAGIPHPTGCPFRVPRQHQAGLRAGDVGASRVGFKSTQSIVSCPFLVLWLLGGPQSLVFLH